MTAKQIQKHMRSLSDLEAARACARFFKTGPGEYGEGDIFLGLNAATLRGLAKEHWKLGLSEVDRLLQSEIHEERSVALLILTLQIPKAEPARQKEIHDYYLANTSRVNNWDLVDCSAPTIVGGYLFDKSRKPLHRLAKSKSIWDRRIGIVATQHFIRAGEFAETLAIAERLLDDEEDLIHKAAGWMLREVGKRDQPLLEGFLRRHKAGMPRTMLRYAIERFPPAARKAYLAR